MKAFTVYLTKMKVKRPLAIYTNIAQNNFCVFPAPNGRSPNIAMCEGQMFQLKFIRKESFMEGGNCKNLRLEFFLF